MAISIQSCLFENQECCQKIFEIRTTVFVFEQQVSREEEFDAFEESAVHYLGSWNDEPAGTARWRVTSKGIKLERFAVKKEFRGRGIAAAILARVLQDVTPAGVCIYLNAQVTAMGFYEKFGFQKTGPLFVEADIDHFKMIYRP